MLQAPMGKIDRHRFAQHRKRLLNAKLGPASTYRMTRTRDYDEKITEIDFGTKERLNQSLKGYEKVEKNVYIGQHDFVVVSKVSWR